MQPGPVFNFGGSFNLGPAEDPPGAAVPFQSKQDNDNVESDAAAPQAVHWRSSPLFAKEKEGAALTAENLKKSSSGPFDAPAFSVSEGLIKAAQSQPQPQAAPAVPSFLAGNSFGVFGMPALQPEDSSASLYTSAISTSMSRQTSFQSLDDDKQFSKFGSMRAPSSLGGSQEALSPYVLADTGIATVEAVSEPESEEPELPAVEPPTMLTPGGSSVAVYARHRALAALAEMSCDAETVMPLGSQQHNETADDGQEEISSGVLHKIEPMPAKGDPSLEDLGVASEGDEEHAISPPPVASLSLDEDTQVIGDCVASLGNNFNPLQSETHVAKPTPVPGKLDFTEVHSPLSEVNLVPDEQLGVPSTEVEGLAPAEHAEQAQDSPLLNDSVASEQQGEYEEGLAMQMSLRQNYGYEYGHDEQARGIQELEERLREAELNAEEEAYRADEALARCARLTQEIVVLKTKLELAEKLASDAEADSDYARHADNLETLQEMNALRAENRSLRTSLQQLQQPQKSADSGARQLVVLPRGGGGQSTASKHARAASYDTVRPHASPIAARRAYDPWNIEADTQQRDLAVERRWVDGELRGSAGFNPLFAGKLMQRERKMDGSSKK